MFNKLIAILCFYCISLDSFSMPAYPLRIKVGENGQERVIRLFGDENNKHAETEDGFTIIQNEQHQWCYAELKNDTVLSASQWLLCHDFTENEKFNIFLESTPKHLRVKRNNTNKNVVSQQNTKAAIGQRRILVILMGFKDLAFTKSQLDYDKLFNKEGYNEDGAQGSVKDYYLDASYNRLELESDVYGPYTALNNMSYYGQNSGLNGGIDVNAYSLFEEAINNVTKDADLRLYDGDGDGFIDNVHIIFAGYGEEAGAESDAIWSHEATLYRPYEIQGLKIDRYSCAPELRGNSGNGISRIGPHCHELGHALGAMDYYDTDYSANGKYLGTGEWDVMASGSWNNEGITPADFNPYVKAYNFGWVTPAPLPQGEVTIHPSNSSADDYYLLKPNEFGDYYILENRSNEKWGNSVPSQGLLIFHIHSDIANAGNDINITAPQMCYVVCASSNSKTPNSTPASYGDINSAGCPFPGSSNNTEFGGSTTPKAFYWDNDACGIELCNISLMENGNIKLENNSVGAGFEPINMETIFFEGFEDEQKVAVHNITQSKWRIEENPENTMTIINKPIAYEGIRCLQLSAKETSTDISDTLDFVFSSQYTSIKRIKICVASLFVRFNKPNIIKIGYRTLENQDWQYIEIYSSENNRWRQSYIDLPSNVEQQIRIVGFVYKGSIIAIDNIIVEQDYKEEAGMKPLPYNVETSLFGHDMIFSLEGIRQKVRRRGINILRQKDGSIIKVFVK